MAGGRGGLASCFEVRECPVEVRGGILTQLHVYVVYAYSGQFCWQERVQTIEIMFKYIIFLYLVKLCQNQSSTFRYLNSIMFESYPISLPE